MREILTKTCFSPQVSHIQLKFAFLLFWCIYGEIQRELLFLFKIMTISERSSELLRKFVFLNKFEKGKIQRKIWICLNNCFWSNHLKGTNINKNFFSPVCEPYTAKLCFSFFLKHFWGNSQRTSFFSPKIDSQKRAQKYSESLFFLTSLKKGKSRGKFGFV